MDSGAPVGAAGDASGTSNDLEVVLALGGGALLFLIVAAQVVRHRLVLRGRFLHHRAIGWRPPVDLDRLDRAAFVAMSTRRLRQVPIPTLRDLDGRAVRIDRVNGDVTPLYRELAARFPSGHRVFDVRMGEIVDRHRDAPGD